MSDWFIWFIVLWTIFLITIMFIGGFFMFRKFLKRLPKEDGKSILDWQDYYIERALPLWDEPQKKLLNELVEPVPEIFRDIAKGKIAGKISEIALKEDASSITEPHIIRGYILATPKRDHKFLIKTLQKKQIDVTPYKHLFEATS
ncbi:DUF2621 domain-containing protein [Alkalicoccobacillus plakortidis]|uniref:DUF2621 domain-containing protein n=1 Tax=Alkalicoccobacillus plakortidis TaxID=444060 RepID=A0ABT0XFT0_9BACI|nr:DUF2621 domain-containing protein [Alkalicoccobacillus plakortidis]MCM2674640.1 DUF2621 domain-containing protein [Alkalicoccobacillus plakortidis]